ncbi:HCN2 [Symbiodinium microadriaticum]|nr:HCN2 [Symbiodinium microadriaticum]
MGSAEIRREDEQLRMFNDVQINKWLQKRKERLANVRPERELTRDMINSLASRGPVQRQKRKPQASNIASGAADLSAKEA